MSERTRLVYFLMAGSAGFSVDALILTALVSLLEWSPYLARVLSFSVAVTVTWYINRNFTFADRPSRHVGSEYARYLVVQIVGVIVNYGTFSAIVMVSSLSATWPVLALVPASLVAMFVTYLGMHHFAFPRAAETAHD